MNLPIDTATAIRAAALNFTEALIAAMGGIDNETQRDIQALDDQVNTELGTVDARLDMLEQRVGELEHPAPPPPPPPPDPVPLPNELVFTASTDVALFTPGWVHTDHDTIVDAPRAAALAAAAPFQGQHMHGFGAPEIQKVAGGTINWSGIDRVFGPPGQPQVGFMRGAKRLFLYGCGCPAYMKVPKPGTTMTQDYPIGDPTLPFKYEPPHRSWYDESADLIARIVARNPQITDVTGWNELKSFWGNGRWTIENYTEWFNRVAARVHAVNPAVRMWAPYCIFITMGWTDKANWDPNLFGKWGHADKRITTALDYFIRNQSGAYGLALDVRNSNRDTFQNYSDAPKWDMAVWLTNPTKGADPWLWPDDPFSSWSKLDDLMSWIRQRTKLPVMMMELYANGLNNTVNANYPNAYVSTVPELTAIAAEGLRKLTTAGYDGGMFWNCQGDANGRANPLGLYDTNGKPTPMAGLCQTFAREFPPGTPLVTASNVPDGLRAIANPTGVLVLNQTDTAHTVAVGGVETSVAPFEQLLLSH